MPATPPRELPPAVKHALDGLDLAACRGCNACADDCPITGLEGLTLDIRAVLHLLAAGRVEEVVEDRFPWLCTLCGRCSTGCPQQLDVTAIMEALRARRARDKVPGTLHKGTMATLQTGNTLAIAQDDYLQTLADLGSELAADACPGFYVPVDKPGSDLLFFPNSKEIFGDFDDMKWWWKIFYAARASWTVPSQNWEALDWGFFTGNRAASLEFARRKIQAVTDLAARAMLMPDDAGASFGCRTSLAACAQGDPGAAIETVYLYDYLIDLVRSGRLVLDRSVNAGRRFAFHDACMHGRELKRRFGRGFYDEPRWLLAQCADDVAALEPDRDAAVCCGAGGGNWSMPHEKESAWYGRLKIEQIEKSGADVVVVACSNCRDQLAKRLPKFHKGRCGYTVMYLWELVARSLVPSPWSQAEIERGQAEAAAQWARLGIVPESL